MDLKEKSRLSELGRLDFKFFCKDILGYGDMLSIHDNLCGKIQSKNKRSRIVLMPRYSYKSCICTVGYALWKLASDPNLRILIYSDTATKAQGFLTDIKNHIYGKAERSKFRDIYGPWETDPHKGKWNESMIELRIRGIAYKEPNVDTGGIETTKVGAHYDIIIFDDIVSDVNTTTKDQMDKTHACYQKSLSLLVPKGETLIVGTRWHFGDLYGRLIEENKKTKEFEIFLESAIVGNEYPFSPIGLDKEFLDTQKARQGSFIFSSLYLNNPVDDETATFKKSDFQFYGTLEKNEDRTKGKYKDLYITATIDPAGEGEDYSAITVCGTDRFNKLYLLDIINKRISPNDQVNAIFRLNHTYHFTKLGVETTFFRGRLEKDIRDRIQGEQTDPTFHRFGVEPFQTRWRRGEGKHQRIEALAAWHERGDLLFPGGSFELLDGDFSTLAYQMLQYPKSPHDDIVDSLSWHIQLTRPGGVPKKAGPPKNSAAWLEQQWLQERERRFKHLPRRYKPSRIRPSFT